MVAAAIGTPSPAAASIANEPGWWVKRIAACDAMVPAPKGEAKADQRWSTAEIGEIDPTAKPYEEDRTEKSVGYREQLPRESARLAQPGDSQAEENPASKIDTGEYRDFGQAEYDREIDP
jgi:hypothetical protein